MYLVYSIVLTLGFLLMTPLFLLRREKYAAGFRERMGNYPSFVHAGSRVIWLHCVSVGEVNAARPLVERIPKSFPDYRLVVSTSTKTGQELAKKVFSGSADAVVYFPFDWKFSVRRALAAFKPSVVLLMETEIWPRFIKEAKISGAKIAIVNGRLSHRSAARYSLVRPFIAKVLRNVDRALMQGETDARRLTSLGLESSRTQVTGNMKFDLELNSTDQAITDELDRRFRLSGVRPLVVAASTHEPEEGLILTAFSAAAAAAEGDVKPRLMIAPRHPERFEAVAKLIEQFRTDPGNEWRQYSFARRSQAGAEADGDADVILLDSIGELRAVYPTAEIVFVGGSLIPHGGQSVLEPAAAGTAIITGHHTHNFADVVQTFRDGRALIQLPDKSGEQIIDELFLAISDLLDEREERRELANNAKAVMKANRGATAKTIERLRSLIY